MMMASYFEWFVFMLGESPGTESQLRHAIKAFDHIASR
jgi:hypothetical protein